MPSDRKPRIFIDGYNLSLEQGTGVATYARNLSFSLRDLGAEVGVLYGTKASTLGRHALLREIAFFDPGMPSGNAFTEALRRYTRPLRSAFGEVATQVPITGQVIRHTFRSRLPHFDHIWNVRGLFEAQRVHFRLYRTRLAVQFRQPPELMHWTYPLALFARGARNIYTIHDLVPLRLPYTTLDNKRSYFRLARLIGRRADHIITVSEASKRDIVNLLGVPSEQVSNTYQAVEIPARYANKPVADVRAELEGTFGLPYKGYFLFFGAIEPKKNVGRMIEAYLASGVTDPLIIVGKKAWKSDEELRLLFENEHVRYLLTQNGITQTRHRVQLVDYARADALPVLALDHVVGNAHAAQGLLGQKVEHAAVGLQPVLGHGQDHARITHTARQTPSANGGAHLPLHLLDDLRGLEEERLHAVVHQLGRAALERKVALDEGLVA